MLIGKENSVIALRGFCGLVLAELLWRMAFGGVISCRGLTGPNLADYKHIFSKNTLCG